MTSHMHTEIVFNSNSKKEKKKQQTNKQKKQLHILLL